MDFGTERYIWSDVIVSKAGVWSAVTRLFGNADGGSCRDKASRFSGDKGAVIELSFYGIWFERIVFQLL